MTRNPQKGTSLQKKSEEDVEQGLQDQFSSQSKQNSSCQCIEVTSFHRGRDKQLYDHVEENQNDVIITKRSSEKELQAYYSLPLKVTGN